MKKFQEKRKTLKKTVKMQEIANFENTENSQKNENIRKEMIISRTKGTNSKKKILRN